MARANVIPLSGTATASGQTIITIPALSTWEGTVTLSATVQVGSGGAAVMASARVSIASAGSPSPPVGDYLRVDLQAPASALGAVGTGDSGTTNSPMVITTDSSPATLVLNATNTTSQSASANGRIL